MKKHLLFTAIAFLFSGVAMAQTCVIDTNNTNLLYPSSDNLPCIERNTPYNTVLQLFTPPSIGGVGVDSIKVTVFNGLPTGITTECNPSSCTMVGFGRACIAIQGTTTDTVGYYTIDYDGYAYTDQGTASFDFLRQNFAGTIPDYTLFVINPGDYCVNTGTSGINSNNQDLKSAFAISPNPNNGVFQFTLKNVAAMGGDITVTDMSGRTVYSQKHTSAFFEATTIDISDLAKGLYTVQYRTKGGVSTKKISIQ